MDGWMEEREMRRNNNNNNNNNNKDNKTTPLPFISEILPMSHCEYEIGPLIKLH